MLHYTSTDTVVNINRSSTSSTTFHATREIERLTTPERLATREAARESLRQIYETFHKLFLNL